MSSPNVAPGPASPHAGPALPGTPYLQVSDLEVAFPTEGGLVRAVDGVSFSLQRGRTLGVVGESGSGKSVMSQALLGLHQGTGARTSGQIVLDGEQLLGLPPARLRELRGETMAMIFQDPLSALHPYFSVGSQIAEAIRVHHPQVSRRSAKGRAVELLGTVGIPNPARGVDQYPHEFSGGMRQRAMIAMALANDPALLVADEPTTALDVTVQAQILDLLRTLQGSFGSAIILITHDLGVVAGMADDVLVLYAGKAVEQGPVQDVFSKPEHPYTWGLLTSTPRLDRARQERLRPVPGNPPSLLGVPPGCPFHPRCQYREHVPGNACREVVPAPTGAAPGHAARCHISPLRRREVFRTDVRPGL